MTKIVSQDNINAFRDFKLTSSKKSEKSSKKKKSKFSSLFRKSSEVQSAGGIGLNHEVYDEAVVEEFLNDVYADGENLRREPGPETLKNYRDSVQKFISYVVGHAFSLSRQDGIINPERMERKQYTIVKTVITRLDQLAVSVLRQERNQIAILEKLNQINGLLVDLKR